MLLFSSLIALQILDDLRHVAFLASEGEASMLCVPSTERRGHRSSRASSLHFSKDLLPLLEVDFFLFPPVLFVTAALDHLLDLLVLGACDRVGVQVGVEGPHREEEEEEAERSAWVLPEGVEVGEEGRGRVAAQGVEDEEEGAS